MTSVLTSFVRVLGISALIALPAFSQSNFSNPVNQVNMRLRGTIQNGKLVGGNVKRLQPSWMLVQQVAQISCR